MAVETAPARRHTTDSVDPTPAPVSAGHDRWTLARTIGWLMAALGFLIGSRVLRDNSFFTHLATGNVILDDGAVPSADVFSFTAEGEPWTVQSWFASVVYRGVFESFGLGGVRIVNGLLAAVLTSTIWRLTARAGTLFPRVLLTGLALVVGAMMWTPRPLLFGLVCFALVIEVIEDRRRPLWLLVPIMWLWVNTHGSFPLAVVFIGAIGVGQLLDDRTFHPRDIRAGLWLVGGILVGALNPVGIRLLTFPIELLSKGEALEDVSEWAAPTWERPSEWSFLVLLLVVVGAAKAGASWRHLLPAFGFFVTGLLAVRNLNPAAVAMVACAAPAMAAIPGSLRGDTSSPIARTIGGLACALMAIVGLAVVAGSDIDYEGYPVLEVDWLEERGLVADDDVQLIHRDTTGNYLELRFGRDANVFMDDRFDMYPQQVIDDHADLYFGGDYAEILARYSADAVLWEADSDFSDWLRASDDWDVTVDNDDWIIAIPA